MKFIDTATILVKSGDGGNGHVGFRKEKFYPMGGPDGGNGGKGGDIIFRGNLHLNTLLDFKFKRKILASNGQKGMKSNKTGKNGQNEVIEVPVGTLIKDAQTGEVLLDLVEANKDVVFLRGGFGGKGNAEFATPTRQAPRFATDGKPGIEKLIEFELKLIADVGIVGLPNVGKSTLISVISAAKPKIADYHFTTLIPNLGIVKVAENKSFVVADIPGLIEGASDGKGLGIQFLRHVERTSVLLFLLDAHSPDIKKDYKVLKNELKQFNPEMLDKEKIIAISRCDSIDEEIMKTYSKMTIDKKKPLLISSVDGKNIQKLVFELYKFVELI